jgi:hypothetical protein
MVHNCAVITAFRDSISEAHNSQLEAASTTFIRADKSQSLKATRIRLYQQGILVLCQVRVNLASSLRAEFSWWMFVSDLALLMQ